ncbi:MAG TPA: ABC transporter permease [Gemmatimonadaceae bacterium]|jgi:predicted permease|nr:ABC transporter permease [Gemmatimonadaceae bacterium]
MTTWRNDLRHGIRMLGKSPAFAAVAILSLAIGIGANSAIFSVANGLILRPLPYRDADRIAIVWQRSPGLNVPRDWLSIGQYLDIKSGTTAFEQVAGAIGASFNVMGDAGGRPERVDGMRVSSSFFSLFGARAAVGRVFGPDDDAPGKAPAVILMHGYWRRRFGGDRDVIGKTLLLNGTTVTIAGVMAEQFSFDKEVMPAVNGIQRVDLLLPLPLPASAQGIRDREDYDVFAKLRPNASFDRAQAELDALAKRMKQQFPANYPANGGLTLSAVPLIDQVVGDVRLALYVLLGAVVMLLVIACGNVGGLLLSRATARERELAIRAAIGAERTRLLRQLLTEQLVLSIAGGIAGLAVAFIAVRALRSFDANIPRAAGVTIDGRVLAFTLAISVAATILFGLLPAWRASDADPQQVLNESARSILGSSRRHAGLRRYVIAAQLALSLVLLIGATLLARSYARITRANPGFDPRHVLTFRVSLPGSRYNTPELVAGFFDQLGRRLSSLPGIEHVGTNYQLPLSSVALAWEPIGVEGYVPTTPGNDLIISSSAYVSPDYFRAMGIPLLTGRFFAPTDNKAAPQVVIVDDKLAARFWPHESAIGKRIRQGNDGPWRTVVGVVADTREYEVDAEPPITAFFPVEQYTIGSRFVVVRTASTVDAASLMLTVARELRAIDPDLPSYDVATMEQRLHDSLARRRLAMSLLVTFAACAFALAIVGVYGLMSYWVGQRARDIGIRIALGADGGRIVTMIAREFAGVVAAGLVTGAIAAIMLTSLMSSMLFGVSARDLSTFVAVPVLLAIVTMLATYTPVRRATRVDPLAAIRME